MVSTEDVIELAKTVGLDAAAAEIVIRRAGSNEAAFRRLKGKRERLQRAALKQHEDRIADRDAEKARTRHAKRQAESRSMRQADRERLTLPERLALALGDAVVLPSLSSGSFAGGGVSSGKKDSAIPPPARSELADFYLVRLRALIGNFERELDAEKYGAAGTAETGEARDLRIVKDYEGWASYEVATFDRSVGSPDTVERARRKHGRLPARGFKPPEEMVA